MGDFLELGVNITKNLAEGIGTFWQWFTNPVISFGNITIAPWMILSFTSLIIIFGASIFHQFNPLG